MITYNKSKFFNILIVVLLLLNTVTVCFLLIRNDKHQPPHQQGGAFNFLVKELALDSMQIQQYQVLRNNHKNKADSIRKEVRVIKDSLFNLIKINDSSDSTIQQKLSIIALHERNLNALTFNHFKLLRAICNAEQQIKFDKVIATAVKMNAPHQDPPHHHPQNGRPPRDEEPDGRPEDDNRPPPPRGE